MTPTPPMTPTPTPTRFDDGEAYERLMGRWSRLVGEIFLDWLAPEPGLRWLDLGCGNGAFTELLVDRCAPAGIQGIDPSEGQLAFARTRHAAGIAHFQQGDAASLPFDDDSFDAAAMALVINLIPEPDKALAELARVVRPGGAIATYMWDIEGGGFTMEPIRAALAQMGVPSPVFGAERTRIETMNEIWRTAGLESVETRRIEIRPTYETFDQFWDWNTVTLR